MSPKMVSGEGVKWTVEARRAWRESQKRRETSVDAMRVSVPPEDAKRRGFASVQRIAADLGVSNKRLADWYSHCARDKAKIHWMELKGNVKLYRASEMKRAYRAWERRYAFSERVRGDEWVTTAEAARMLGYASPAAARFSLHRRFVKSCLGRSGKTRVHALYWCRREVAAYAAERKHMLTDEVPAGYVWVRTLLKGLCSNRGTYNHWMNMGLLRGVLLKRMVNGTVQDCLYVCVDDLLKVAGMKLDMLLSRVDELREFLRRFGELKLASGEAVKSPQKTKVKKGEKKHGK